MEHDHLGTRGLRDARGVVEHPKRHFELLATVDVPHERCERRVHGEQDVVCAKRVPEDGSRFVVEPEAPREADLDGAVAGRREQACRLLEVRRGQPGGTDPNSAHAASLVA